MQCFLASEKLPEKGQTVLGIYKDNTEFGESIQHNIICYFDGTNFKEINTGNIEAITYWIEIP